MSSSKTICFDGIWNESLITSRKHLVFTNCFQWTILLIPPLINIIIFLPWIVLRICRKKKLKSEPIHTLDCWYALKLIIPLFVMIFLGVEIILESTINHHQDPILYIFTGFLLVNLILSPIFMESKRLGNKMFEYLLVIFWWLMNATYVIRFYSNIVKYVEKASISEIILIDSIIVTALLLTCLILDSFSWDTSQFKTPEEKASIISKITYSWMDSYIYQWIKTSLTDENTFDLNKDETSHETISKIEHVIQSKTNQKMRSYDKEYLMIMDWEENNNGRMPEFNLFKSLLQVHWKVFILSNILKLLQSSLHLVIILLIKVFLKYIEKKDAYDTWQGIVIALGFLIVQLMRCTCENYSMFLANKLSIRFRASLIGLVQKKILSLSNESRQIYQEGDIVNMANVDIEQIMYWLDYSNSLLSFPILFLLILTFIYYELEYSLVIPILIVLAALPICLFLMKFARYYSREEFIIKDKRTNAINELLSGIQIIKMYAWEKFFDSKISKIRNEEIKSIKKLWTLQPIIYIGYDVIVNVLIYATLIFYSYIVSPEGLNTEKIFITVSLFLVFHLPYVQFVWDTFLSINAYIAIERFEKYLLTAEKYSMNNENIKGDPDSTINIQNAYFSWNIDDKPLLNNINLKVPKNHFLAIVGRVGVGKSSLLSAILGDLHTLSGSINVQGTLAYVPQESWIQNKTVKDNILFTKQYDKPFYNRVVRACTLEYDMNLFPFGDETEIGERGINLSGGQKQRVSLARAIYQDRDIYLLDDPLSAVDVKVGQQLFDNVLSNEGLLKNKTRILVTHGIKWLPYVDEIIVLNDEGEISERGTYQQLIDCHKEFDTFIKEYLQHQETTNKANESSNDELSKYETKHKSFIRNNDITKSSMTKFNEEKLLSGNINWNTLFWYTKNRGLFIVLLSLLFAAISIAFQAYGLITLRHVANLNRSKPINDQINDIRYIIHCYSIISLAEMVFLILFWIGFVYSALVASGKIHGLLLKAILHAPLSFFNLTPSGRILNRFSRDIYVIDHFIHTKINYFTLKFLILIASFIMISIVTPWFGLISFITLILYIILQRLCILASIQSRRLESNTSSYIFTHIAETYRGSSVIKSFKADRQFQNIQNYYIDASNKFKQIQYLSLRWFSYRIELLGSLVMFCVVLFVVMNRHNLNIGDVVISLTYALQSVLSLNIMMRILSDFEVNFVSIERLQEYCSIPSEPELYSKRPLMNNWVRNGSIAIEDFSLKYDDQGPLVLNNISVNFERGEKIGIVGRTGAGKSSLTLALFRLFEGCKGNICIDGINIKSIGLHELRKQITILPQDPIIFSDTIRYNLDPFNEYVDEELLKSLETSGLSEWVSSINDGLDYNCGNMGSNLSTGQKQLMCLARALLRKSKIVILDEATASVDEQTDRLIMSSVRREFSACTVLIIAHRISTIMDCDKILVLENGSIVESGNTKDLITNSSSLFKMMLMNESEQ